LSVQAFQFVRGQVLLNAFGFASFTCSGVVQNWAVTAESFAGFFKQGQANVRVRLSTFVPGGSVESKEVTGSVRLRRGEPPPESPPESPPQSPPAFGAMTSKTGIAVGSAFGSMLALGLGVGFVRVLGPGHRRKDTER